MRNYEKNLKHITIFHEEEALLFLYSLLKEKKNLLKLGVAFLSLFSLLFDA